jgi:hypothetical protein
MGLLLWLRARSGINRAHAAGPRHGRSWRSKPRAGFRPRVRALDDRYLPSALTVVNTLDSGAGSLRDAITRANSGDTIVFASSLDGQTITLTSGQLTVSKSLDIEGPGAALLAISGNNTNRVFDINEGLTVTIAGLTITHGRASGFDAGGGGIHIVGSTVTLADDVLAYNTAVAGGPGRGAQGGAIGNLHGATLTVTGSSFIGNKAVAGDGGATHGNDNTLGGAEGGALHNEAACTITNSTFSDNRAIAGNGGTGDSAKLSFVDYAQGGAVYNEPSAAAVLEISGCTFSYNQAVGGSNATGGPGAGVVGNGAGGGLVNLGIATVTNSKFDHNMARGGSSDTGASGNLPVGAGLGGGIFSRVTPLFAGVTLTVGNLTLTDNQAVGGAGDVGGALTGDGIGGGLANGMGAAATVTGCTFTGNQAVGGPAAAAHGGGDGLGGAVANILGATLTVSGCTLTGNQAEGGAGGAAGNGGNGSGAGIFNDGLSMSTLNPGTPTTLTITASTVSGNAADGGAAGVGGSAGQGAGGGAYFVSGGAVCLDALTTVSGNTASTNDNDLFGTFAPC